MGGEWERVRLGDLVNIRHGWPFKSELYSLERGGKPIVISIGNFRYEGGFRFSETTAKEYLGDYPKDYELQPGDVLLVMTCQTPGGEILGIPARVPGDGRTYLHNQRLGLVVPRSDRANLRFLYWLFVSKSFNAHLVSSATGTKILHTAPSRIESFQFTLPDCLTQSRIATLLDMLDDKIELYRRTNEALEAMARALFKSWFVDFDPVRAKAEGRAPACMDAATAALFPSELVDSELGPIPKGWAWGRLEDLSRLERRVVNPSAAPDECFAHFSIPSYDTARWPDYERGSSIRSNKFSIEPGYVLVSKLNPRIPRVWSVQEWEGRGVASTEFLPLVVEDRVERSYVVRYVESQGFVERLAGHASGTSNSHQRVRPETVMESPVLKPSRGVLEAFSRLAEPWSRASWQSTRSSRTLAALRDALLPRLLSGELDVSRLEAAGVAGAS